MTTITTEKIDVDQLANEIRRVDGAHSLGAGALAEALMPFITRAIAERAMVPQPQGKDQRWKLTDEDGSVSYTDRWDVAKHHPNAQPQGQALPDEHFLAIRTKLGAEPKHISLGILTDASAIAFGRAVIASQLALPAGPVPEDGITPEDLMRSFEYCANHIQRLLDIVDKHAGGSSGATENIHEYADSIKINTAKLRAKLSASPSPAVAQPVADERAEYERMLRAGYQHDNVRRQERGLASTDELTEGQEREIAERVALKFPSGAGLRKDSPVAFSCARRAAHPTSWTMTCDKHCGDDAKCLRAALCPPAEEGDKA